MTRGIRFEVFRAIFETLNNDKITIYVLTKELIFGHNFKPSFTHTKPNEMRIFILYESPTLLLS